MRVTCGGIVKKPRIQMKQGESFPQIFEERYHAISEKEKSKRSNGRILVSSNSDTNLYAPPLVSASLKRKLPGIESNRKEKRRKLNRSMTKQCSIILKQLMSHPFGWLFNQPVDPVKLNIPDYFSIVTNPMDLGTILAKLEKHSYSSAEEFEADVELTFSNAMLYNPPANQVHIAAKEIRRLFDSSWRSLESKWNQEQQNLNLVLKPCGKETNTNISLNNNNSSFTQKAATTKPLKMQEHCRKPPVRNNIPRKDNGNKASLCPVNGKRSTKLVSVCTSCGSPNCQCHLQNNGVHEIPTDLSKSSERSEEHDLTVLRKDSKPKSIASSQVIKPVPDSDSDNAPSIEMNTIDNIQVPESPKKALRTAMLLSRYSGLIVKTIHGKADPIKLQKEKSKLEKQQQIEQQKIKDEMQKFEMQRKKEIEAARQSSRRALEKLQATIEENNSYYNFREFEKMCNCSLSYPHLGNVNILQSIGLFIKEEMIDDTIY